MRAHVAGTARLLAVIALAGCSTVGRSTTPPVPAPAPQPAPQTQAATPRADIGPVRTFSEVRAVWVVRFTLTSDDAIRAMVDRAYTAGINTLIVQVRGRGDAFYRSDLEPPGESIREEGLDPLARVIELGHQRGMAVHAWVNTHLVWGPAPRPESPTHLINEHPDWLAVPRPLARELAAVDPFEERYFQRLVAFARDNPGTVEGVYTSPSHPEVQDRVHAVWLDLASRYDLDGIHFDYIRFPSGTYDYSLGALERFRVWVRGALPQDRFAQLDAAYASDLFAFVDGEPDLWDTFRRDRITGLVTRIYRDVKAVNPRLTVSAAVVADPDLAFGDRFQDWGTWLRDGVLDVAAPMAYTPDAERFQTLMAEARRRVDDPSRLWMGIGAYMTSPEGTVEMIDIARGQGSGGVVIFSYDWAAGPGRGDPENPFLQRVGRQRFGR